MILVQCPVAFSTIQSLFEESLEVDPGTTALIGWPVRPEGAVDIISGPMGAIVYLHPLTGRWQQVVSSSSSSGRPFIGVLEDALVFGATVGWKMLTDFCYEADTTPLQVRLHGHNLPQQVGPVWAEWLGLHEPVNPTWLKQVFEHPQIQVLSAEAQPRRTGGTFSRMIFTRQ